MLANLYLQYNFGGKQFLAIQPATLVPFEPKLINYDLLSDHHVRRFRYISYYSSFTTS